MGFPRYARSVVSKHNSLYDAPGKARANSRHWEQKAKEGPKKATGLEKKRDEAKEEAQIPQLAIVATGDARALAEDDMAKVRDALAFPKEAKHKAKAKTAPL